jgi:HEAT repeat protein
MRKFKLFRQIFACLPVLAVGVVLLFSSSSATSQDDLAVKQEERSTPAVDALKEALAAPVLNPQDKEELEARRKTLQDRLNDLKGIRDLRLALSLREWRDEGDPQLREVAAAVDRALALGGVLEFVPFSPEEAVALLVDRSIHKELEARPTRVILDGLNSGDPTLEIAAATLLAEIGTQLSGTRSRRGFAAAFAPELAKTLHDHNPAVVEAAARALGQINPDPDIAGPALARVLASGRDGERQAAAEALADQIQFINRIKPVVSPLSFTLGKKEATDEDRIRVAASVVSAASRGLRDNNAIVRRLCAETVQRAAATLEDIIPYAGTGKIPADVSGLARSLADQCGTELAEGPLAADLKDPDVETRLASAHALNEIARALARSTRSGTAGPPPAEIKGKIGADLGASPAESLRRGLRSALPALSKSLHDPDVRVRLAVANVLDLMGQEAAPAAGALAEALKDRDIFVRWAAARALGNINLGNINPADGKAAVRNLGRLLFDRDLDPRLAAAATLEHYGKDAVAAVPLLARAVGFGDAEGRVAAIHALVAIGPDAKPAVPSLAQALSDPDDRVRQAAGEALGSLGPLAQSAEPALRRALNDPEGTVRRAASGALLNLKRE